MKPKFKTTLLHNRHVVGYHTNECCSVSSFATNHYVYMDDELKEVHWIADQYLIHAFHIAAAIKCAFKSHLIGLEGDEIVLYIKCNLLMNFQLLMIKVQSNYTKLHAI